MQEEEGQAGVFEQDQSGGEVKVVWWKFYLGDTEIHGL